MSGEARRVRDARRLTRLYPRRWRERFGAEFEQLLIDEMRDRRRSPTRTGDVLAHALLAHLSAAGLVGDGPSPADRARHARRRLGVLTGVFLTVGIGMWSQVAVGWTWAAPTAEATRIAMDLMSGALLGCSAAFTLAAVLGGWSIARRGRPSVGALLRTGVSVAALWTGCRHVSAHWPGAGASGWAARSVVPAGLARLGWAGTLWMSAYWRHPTALLESPGGGFAWLIVSPLLLATASAGALRLLDHARPSPRVVRGLVGLGALGVASAAVFVAGAAIWILAAGSGPGRMYQAGTVDDLGLAVLTVALLVATRLTRRRLVAVRGAPAG